MYLTTETEPVEEIKQEESINVTDKPEPIESKNDENFSRFGEKANDAE